MQELINEAKARGGGMLLNMEGQPKAVVLMIEKYNELLSNFNLQTMANNQSGEQAPMGANKKILVTGGAGYIGSHAAGELINSGHKVVIIDNLSSGKRENLNAAAKFYEGDIKDINFLRDVFANENISTVMHFAASIEVGESVEKPEMYFENNVVNTARLLEAMHEAGVKNIIFSSTAAVYGEPDKLPIAETAPVRPTNPYGYTKLLAEKNIKYFCQFAGFHAVVFRYFNACGCRPGGDVVPTHHSHLIDNVMEVALGHQAQVSVLGNDYPTFDGTGVRDYIHVSDIARAHVLALEHLSDKSFEVFNIGTGKGLSVLEIINAAAENLNKIIPMEVVPRRAGDPAELVADAGKILQAWGFKPEFSDLDNIIKTAYKQKTHAQTIV